MAIGDVIVGIDIRASRTSLIVGEVNSFNQIEVVCSTSTKSNGIQKGKIINEEIIDYIAEVSRNTKKSSRRC